MKKSSIILLVTVVSATVIVGVRLAFFLSGVVPYWKCSEVYAATPMSQGWKPPL